MTIVYKSSIDLFLYVVGSSQENEVNSGGWGDKEGLSVGEWLGVWGGSWVPLLLNSGGSVSSQNGSFWDKVYPLCPLGSLGTRSVLSGALVSFVEHH